MFKKDDNIKYFVGGTAVGVAAGIFLGKLMIPSLSALVTQNIESGSSTKRNVNEHSQDDNIFNSLYSQKKDNCNPPRSKSASRYKDKISNDISSCITPFEKQLGDSISKINNLTLGQKSDTRLNKISQDQLNQLPNISIENNIAYGSYKANNNLLDEHYINQSEEGNNYYRGLPKSENLKNLTEPAISVTKQSNFTQCDISLPTVLSCVSPKEINIENLNVSDRKNVLKKSEVSKHFDVPAVLKNLSSNTNVDEHSNINNLRKIQMCAINSYIFGNELEDATNSATCNTNLNIEEESEDRIRVFTSSDEFQEVDLVSSTKRDNSDDL